MSKAGRPKKGSAGLPEWFDIEKYRQAKTYGAAEWFSSFPVIAACRLRQGKMRATPDSWGSLRPHLAHSISP